MHQPIELEFFIHDPSSVIEKYFKIGNRQMAGHTTEHEPETLD